MLLEKDVLCGKKLENLQMFGKTSWNKLSFLLKKSFILLEKEN